MRDSFSKPRIFAKSVSTIIAEADGATSTRVFDPGPPSTDATAASEPLDNMIVSSPAPPRMLSAPPPPKIVSE